MLIAKQYAKGQINLMDELKDKLWEESMRKALSFKICTFISPTSGMLDVDGLVDYLLERIKEKNEANIS